MSVDPPPMSMQWIFSLGNLYQSLPLAERQELQRRVEANSSPYEDARGEYIKAVTLLQQMKMERPPSPYRKQDFPRTSAPPRDIQSRHPHMMASGGFTSMLDEIRTIAARDALLARERNDIEQALQRMRRQNDPELSDVMRGLASIDQEVTDLMTRLMQVQSAFLRAGGTMAQMSDAYAQGASVSTRYRM